MNKLIFKQWLTEKENKESRFYNIIWLQVTQLFTIKESDVVQSMRNNAKCLCRPIMLISLYWPCWYCRYRRLCRRVSQLRQILQQSTAAKCQTRMCDGCRNLTVLCIYLFRHQQTKHVLQQRNEFHKGRQPEGQMTIMLAIYSTSRLIVTKMIC